MVLSETENLRYGTPKQDLEPQIAAPQLIESVQEDQSLNKDLQLSPLGGQNSLMSLTLNEIQLKSGKNFGSMNMDEFLANLWTNVDDNNNNQLVPTSNPPNQANEPAKPADTEPPTLARQGSFSIPAPLCKKTVDEVWDEIQKDQPNQQTNENSNCNTIGVNVHPLKQQTFGEMTLEDFLVKAGVVQEAPPSSGQNHSSNSSSRILTSYQNTNSCLETSFGLGQLISLGLPSPHSVGTNNGFSPYHHMFPNKAYGEATSNAEVKTDRGQEEMNDMNAHHNKNKRIIDGPLEVVVERRQRRMIKNRESAARSRARKQAYTVELELELDQLKQENTKLKLIVEEIERKRKEEVLKRKVPTGLKRKVDRLRAIRRTASLTW